MGTPEWKGGTWLLFFVVVFSFSAVAEDSSNDCDMQPCWELYQQANTYYRADEPGASNQQARKCTVLRTYRACLTRMETSSCAGALDYMGTRRVLRIDFIATNCSEDGPVYPEGPEPEKAEPVTPCKFKGLPIYNYCVLFGDPHLVTFEGKQATCKLEGAWPLIDNEFLTVQVTNTQLPASTKTATVTEKVTVVIKGRGSSTSPNGAFCGSRDAVFYRAEIGALSTTFSDGMREYGAYSSIQVNTVTPGEQVEIYMRYIDTTVIIRQINNEYLSVGVRIPEKVLNGTINDAEGGAMRQLCIDSCPNSEKVDIGQLLAEISSGSSEQRSSYASAQRACREKDVTDFFFDSCVFDLLMTGEPLFSSMANSAYEDVKKYASRQPRWSNRTHLEQYTKPSGDGGQRGAESPLTSAACRLSHCGSLIRTLLFVYIMHVISFKLAP